MSKLEKDVVAKVKKWCDDNGVLFIKFNPMGSKGWPDTIVVFPGGLHLWVEFKRRGKVPRQLQFHRMGQLLDKGALAVWFDDADQCIDYMKDCLAVATEVNNEQTVDTPQIPAKGNRDPSEAVRSRTTIGSGDGKDSNVTGIIRDTEGV